MHENPKLTSLIFKKVYFDLHSTTIDMSRKFTLFYYDGTIVSRNEDKKPQVPAGSMGG